MPTTEEQINIFQDTISWLRSDHTLAEAVQRASGQSVVYYEGRTPPLPALDTEPHEDIKVHVTKERSFEAAIRLHRGNPDTKIAVHNFASATNPGGGVTRGARAQEECLCRCSTLYPVLAQPRLMKEFYQFHRDQHDVRYTDRCIYSPGIYIIKSDTAAPMRLPKEEWVEVDIITAAAPNLRPRPYNMMNPGSGAAISVSDEDLLKIHINRARHMLSVAAINKAEILVLGAFGCGAFQNNPNIVARAYQTILSEFKGRFKEIVFAVYCSPKDMRNYEEFSSILG